MDQAVINKAVLAKAHELKSTKTDLADPEFNQELKSVVLRALLEGKLIRDFNDPVILGKTVQECAALIAKNSEVLAPFSKEKVEAVKKAVRASKDSKNATMFLTAMSGPVSTAVVCLAKSLAEGSNDAGRKLYSVYLQYVSGQVASSSVFAKAKPQSPMLVSSVKAALKVALIAAGSIQSKNGVLVDTKK